MQAFRRKRRQRGQVEAFQQVERQQRGDSLPVGGTLVDAVRAKRDAGRRFPRRNVRRQVIERQAAARLLERVHDGFGNRPLVERRFAAFGNRAQRARQPWVAEPLARSGRASVNGQFVAVEAWRNCRSAPRCQK